MSHDSCQGGKGGRRLPPWIKKNIPRAGCFTRTREVLERLRLDTVCSEARCPNRAECYARSTATFLVMGPSCTRSCAFCSVSRGAPSAPDPNEPQRIAEAVSRLGIRHCVITSVTRDDLPDGGASHFALCVEQVRNAVPEVTVEVLTPDFHGSRASIETVAAAKPDVFNHNVETVPSLYPVVRPGAMYDRSMGLLRTVKEISPSTRTKSGIMLGLGETDEEVERVLGDLRMAGVDFLTIGQYLKPAQGRAEVARFVEPGEFDRWKERAISMGFAAAACGPFVRSSYRAGEMLAASVEEIRNT